MKAAFPQWLHSRGAHPQTIRDRVPFNVADAHNDARLGVPEGAYASVRGYRSLVVVPLLRHDEAIGTVSVTRREPGGFTNDEIALLQTFADQAVIAIENVRLFTELQEKNRALTQAHAQVSESLEQQTATSEILRVIAASPTDVQPVFETIAQSAARLCEAFDAVVYRVEGDVLRPVTHHGSGEVGPIPLVPGTANGRAVIERRLVHVTDIQAETNEFPEGATISQREGTRSFVSVPLLREGRAIGTIAVRRFEVRPFGEKQIALLRTFADQAVISIENTRLFKELETRNRDLTEALDRQTATAEILRVISQAQTEVQPVFDAIVDNAVRLFRAWSAAIWQTDGELLHLIAARGGLPGSEQTLRGQSPWPIDRMNPGGRCVAERTVINIPNVERDPVLDPALRVLAHTRGWRSVLAAPIVRDEQPIGAITVTRAEVGSFSPAEVELLQTFAAQAVIAIENARLLTELRARTQQLTRSVEQLTALGEVGRAVSSTLDLETVLITIVSRAVELSGLDGGVVFEYDENAQEFVQRAATEQGGDLAMARRTRRIRRGVRSAGGDGHRRSARRSSAHHADSEGGRSTRADSRYARTGAGARYQRPGRV